MILKKFENSTALEDNLLSLIEVNLRIETKSSNEVKVLLSCGAHSLNLYKRFKEISKVDWSKVKFGLVDEKWIDNQSNKTNFYNISQALGETILQKASITPMIYDLKDENNNLSLSKLSNSIFLNKKSIVLLELGLDGHTASLFPHEFLKFRDINDCLIATHPTSGQKRISLSEKIINNAKEVIFHVTGSGKKQVVEEIINQKGNYKSYPGSYINPKSSNLSWYLDFDAAEMLTK